MKKYLTQLCIIPLLVLAFAAVFLLKNDFGQFMLWWGGILLCGLVFIPAGNKLFKEFNDKGFLFSKALGIVSAAYLLWFMSSLKILPATGFAAIACLFVLGFTFFVLFKWGSELKTFFKTPANIRLILLEEALFFLCLLFWTMLRGQKPEINGLEKFMDFGFVNSILRTPFAPPTDMWMAGSPINYYYFGQYVSAFITALTGVKPSIAYNLMMSTLFAFTFVLSFSLVFNIIRSFYPIKLKQGKKLINTPGGTAALIGGLVSATAVSLGGNLHYFVYSILLKLEQKLGLFKGELKDYWFPDATRYIGYNPPTTDKTIHEFPLYSFIVSDLHAHVVNIIFVISILAVLFVYLLRAYTDKPSEAIGKRWFLPEPELLLAGFLIGIFHMSNYWDFPIYFTVTLIIVFIASLHQHGFCLYMLLTSIYKGSMVIILSELVALPFTLSFVKIAGSDSIKFVEAHSPFYQLLVLWGCPLLFTIVFLTYIFAIDKSWKLQPVLALSKNDKPVNKNQQKKVGKLRRLLNKTLMKVIDNLHPADIFAAVLCLCAIGLVAAPEIVYVKDIYTGDYKRANTMFKLTYQSFIMFGLTIGYIFVRVGFTGMRPKRNIALKTVLLIIFALTMLYPFKAINSWYGAPNPANYKGLDGLAFLSEKYPDDLAAINWLNTNVKGHPTIIEAYGLSYTDNCRISMATGLPTIVGWFTHEHLWRNSTEIVSQKNFEVKQVYEDVSVDDTSRILKKYNVKYIIIGKIEREKYKALNESKLLSLGSIAFDSPTTRIIEVKEEIKK